ncbi:MAG: cell envelope integrity EipB family protein [Hyphomicrobiales bacterium]|nr:cell envelope integrity EipB family protein [Hyphomicrobiales bacterium]
MGASRQFVIIALALLATCNVQQASARFLASHRAIYDLALDKASDKSGITSLSGRMVYEFSGSPCEGYTTNFRYVTRINTENAPRLTDQQTTTFEDGDGKTFSFATKSLVDGDLDKEVEGVATRGPDDIAVKLTKPQKADLKLRQTWFPTQHLVELLGKAEHGEHFYETSLFDGSDDADRVMTTTVVIGKRKETKADDPEYAALGSLKNDPYWPVTIAYFDTSGGKGSGMLPTYSISLKLHDNGITRDLLMDYGDFSVKGRLVDLSVFEPHKDKCGK